MARIDAAAEKCGYSTYSATHATFPPSGLLPLPGNSTEAVPGCSLWEEIFDAALLVNPAFNIYRIFDTVRSLLISSSSDLFILSSSQSCGTFSVFRTCHSYSPAISPHRRPVYRGSFEQAQTTPLYFDRDDVKQVIHAPMSVDWTECSNIRVFLRPGDTSLPSSFTVLPSIIEKSERSVIVHGLGDYILIAEG